MIGTGAALRKATQKVLLGAFILVPVVCSADPQEDNSRQLIARLESVSMPIGKGAILQDRNGCLWSVMEGDKAPRMAMVYGDDKKPLCRKEEASGLREGVTPQPN
ncbi:hypothetical protein D3M70_30750 [Pseudomonas sp. LS-2]|nr:hypothetical protein D3M70_30750 [Pseudomonas sp. LS-2]